MIEAAVGRGRGGVGAVVRRHRSDKDIGAPDLQVDARLALLHGAQDLGAQRFLEPLRHRLGVGRAQMNVVPGEFGHAAFSLLRRGTVGSARLPSVGGLFRKQLLLNRSGADVCRKPLIDDASSAPLAGRFASIY